MVKIFLISLCLIIDLSLAKGSKPLINQKNKLDTDSQMIFKEIVKAEISYVYDSRSDKVVSVNFDNNKNIASKTSYKTRDQKLRFIFNDSCKLEECLQFIHD